MFPQLRIKPLLLGGIFPLWLISRRISDIFCTDLINHFNNLYKSQQKLMTDAKAVYELRKSDVDSREITLTWQYFPYKVKTCLNFGNVSNTKQAIFYQMLSTVPKSMYTFSWVSIYLSRKHVYRKGWFRSNFSHRPSPLSSVDIAKCNVFEGLKQIV